MTTQGNNLIVVEIPGDSRADLVDTVKRQAQLRFRLVACTSVDNKCGAPPRPRGSGPGAHDRARGRRDPAGRAERRHPAQRRRQPGSGSKNRAPFFAGDTKTGGSSSDASEPSPSESAEPVGLGLADARRPSQPPADGALVDQPLKWMDNPDPASVAAFNAYQCPPPGETAVVEDDPDKPLVTCDEDGIKYLLSVAMIEGTDLDVRRRAASRRPASTGSSTSRSTATRSTTFARDLAAPCRHREAVRDRPRRPGHLGADDERHGSPTAQAEISGEFGEAEAQSLATSLKFGALPISFDDDSTQVDVVGPSLAGNQLSAGLMAGAFGLAPGDALLPALLPRARPGGDRVPARGGRHDVRPGAAAQRERGLHAVPARRRRPDRGCRHHRGLVHRLLRADP